MFMLPTVHSEQNLMEMIWTQVKSCVACEHTIFKIKEVKELTHKALSDVEIDYCRNTRNTSRKLQKNFSEVVLKS